MLPIKKLFPSAMPTDLAIALPLFTSFKHALQFNCVPERP